jgi:MFS family permease
VFFINLPVAAFAMLVTWRTVPEEQVDDADRRMDYVGVVVLALGAAAVLIALDEGPTTGFGDPVILTLLVIGLVALALFLPLERLQGGHALLPTDVRGNRAFVRAALAMLLMSAIFFAALLFLPQFMQKELGFGPLQSGVGLLPMMLVFGVVAFAAGRLYDRVGPRVTVGSGAALLALGMAMLAFIDADTPFAALVPGMVVLGAGVGLFYSSVTTFGVTVLDPARASLAGGILYMCQIAGGAVGLGVNTAIVVSADTLPEGIRIAFGLDAGLAAVGLLVILGALPGAPRAAPATEPTVEPPPGIPRVGA